MKYECPCGYVYDPALGDPENGVAPGTAWEDVPEDWKELEIRYTPDYWNGNDIVFIANK